MPLDLKHDDEGGSTARRSGQVPPASEYDDQVGGRPAQLKPLAVSVEEFCRLTSLKRTTFYKLAKDRRIETRRILGRTVVLMSSIEALLEGDR